MLHILRLKIALILLFLGLSLAPVHSAVILVAPSASTTGSIQITEDITFSVITAGTFTRIIFDDLVSTTDGSATSAAFVPTTSFSLSINGTPLNVTTSAMSDNAASATGNLTTRDGYIALTPFSALQVGDIVTIHQGTYTLAATPNFNPQVTQTFTGNMFLTATATRISNIVSVAPVPEPSAAVLLGGFGVFLALRRKIRKG